MKINGKKYRTVWMEGTDVKLINQLLLPHEFSIYTSINYRETANSIKTMIVRGAPAIGGTAAYGLAQAALEFEGMDFISFKRHIGEAENLFKSTRPTARDLFHALEFVKQRILKKDNVASAKKEAVKASAEYAHRSIELCMRIGYVGEKLIKNGDSILSHCNAGSLACIDFGTNLAPIRVAHLHKKKVFVYVDETRPRNQGSLLTAWELEQEGIPHAIIADNAAGYFMSGKEINLVITGADRIAANGDVANKIGTYEKAVLAKENKIPFYVAAPTTTIDLNIKTGEEIPIEERSPDEILSISGPDESGKIRKILIANKHSLAKNPAFDITPAKYITGIITEYGILKPEEKQIKKLFGR